MADGPEDVSVAACKYDITKIEPTKHSCFTILEEGDPITDGFVQHVELLIPAYLYMNNYKSLTQLNKNKYAAAVSNYINAIELFGFFASCVFDEETDDEGHMVKTRKIHLELVRENSDVYQDISEKLQSQLNELDEEDRRGVNLNESIKQLLNDAEFQRHRSKLRVIALRLRITMISKKYSFAGIINSITIRNSNRDTITVRKNDSVRKRKKNTGRPDPFFSDMTRTSYAQLCSWYTANPDINSNECSQKIWEANNPINPLNVFSIERSMNKARNLGADIYSTDIDLYLSESARRDTILTPMFPIDVGGGKRGRKKKSDDAESGDTDENQARQENEDEPPPLPVNDEKTIPIELRYSMSRFPFYLDVYELESKCINPQFVVDYILPHKLTFGQLNDRELDVYIKENMGSLADDPNATEEDIQRRKNEIIAAYYNTITCSIENLEKLNIETLREHVQSVKLQLRKVCGTNLSAYGILWEKARLSLLPKFLSIFSSDGNCGDAIKAIARFGEEYLETNENFCLPLEKQTKNLTLFEDNMIVRAAQQEVYEQTSVSHIESESQLVKMLHVYFGHALNPNILNIGDGDSGKTFMVERILSELIPGSWEKVNNESIQSRLVSGDAMNFMIEFWDDVPAVFWGVQNVNGKSDPESDKRSAFLKNRLTCGKLIYLRKFIDENGQHKMVKLHADCKSFIASCLNYLPPGQFLPPEMYSRACVRDSEVPKRSDNITTCNKNQIKPTKEMELAKLKKYTRMRRTHYLIAMIGQLTYCELLDMDMTGARILNDQILSRCKQRGLTGTDKPRNYHFVECVERVLTAWKAVVDCFDSYLSEFIKYDVDKKQFIYEPWKPEHIFAVEKYLVCTKEVVSMSFGYMENQFETPAFQRVKQLIKDESCKPERQVPVKSPTTYDYKSSITQSMPGPHLSPATTSSSSSSGSHIRQPLADKTNTATSTIQNRVQFNSLMSGINNAKPNPQTINQNNPVTAVPLSTLNQQSMHSYMMNASMFNNNNNKQDVNAFTTYENNVKKYDTKEDGYINIYFRPDTNIVSTWWRERDALKYMKENIVPVMSDRAIESAINALKKLNVPEDPLNESSSNMIPALKFGVNCWKVATSLFSNPVKNVLVNCVKEVLSYKGAPKQDMLYGKANTSALHIYQTLMIRPPEGATPLVHRDYGYFDRQTISLSEAGQDSVKISIGRSSKDLVDAVIKENMLDEYGQVVNNVVEGHMMDANVDELDVSGGFAKFAYLKIDCDIDKLSIYTHASRTATHDAELTDVGAPVHPIEHAKILVDGLTSNPNLIVYPNGLELFCDPDYINKLNETKIAAQLQVNSQVQIVRSLYSNDNNNNERDRLRKINNKVRILSEEIEKKRLMFRSKRNQVNPFQRQGLSPSTYSPSSDETEPVSQYRQQHVSQSHAIRYVGRDIDGAASSATTTTSSSSSSSSSSNSATTSSSSVKQPYNPAANIFDRLEQQSQSSQEGIPNTATYTDSFDANDNFIDNLERELADIDTDISREVSNNSIESEQPGSEYKNEDSILTEATVVSSSSNVPNQPQIIPSRLSSFSVSNMQLNHKPVVVNTSTSLDVDAMRD